MALDLFMLGLIVQDMGEALTFYRRLGLDIPEGSEDQTHVEIKMGTGLTFFLDSAPARWDPLYGEGEVAEQVEESNNYRSILEFYLETQAAVEAKHSELTDLGYRGHRAPYITSFGMCFAMIKDPDGNIILISGDAA